MSATEWILSRQVQWARSHGIQLVGSKGERGYKAYTPSLLDNLFIPLDAGTRTALSTGDGGELTGSADDLPKMHAVHSSSVLGVNTFQYWAAVAQVPAIAAACGFCREGNLCSEGICFEVKYPICEDFQYCPNIDVVLTNADAAPYDVFAVECKFTEAYSSWGHAGIDPKYLDLKEIWAGIPSLHRLASSISPKDDACQHLHRAQLIKHILGLRKEHKNRFRLLYLWYDALGEEGAQHQKEIGDFEAIAREDGVKFHALSYQTLIMRLAKRHGDQHGRYIDYMASRYL